MSGDLKLILQLIKKILAPPINGTLDVYSPDHSRTFCYVGYAVKKIFGFNLYLLEEFFTLFSIRLLNLCLIRQIPFLRQV